MHSSVFRISPSYLKMDATKKMLMMNVGKGDLVGCDISQHLQSCSNGQGGQNQHGSSGSQDVIVKSSSDVKVNVI